jgi:hypothetical protein
VKTPHKKKGNPRQTNRSSKPKLPTTIIVEMTPKLYEALKQQRLQQVNPIARSHINTYFEWLKTIKPEEVVDAIEQGTTPEQAYKALGLSPLRLGIAAARGFLKVAKKYQNQLRQVATLNLALLTLRFENPSTYAIIQRYGNRGTQFLNTWIKGSLGILGVKTD